jgi:hypothetical protein
MATNEDVNRYQTALFELDQLEKTKKTTGPDGKTIYNVGGVEYTQAGFNKLVSEKQKEVRRYYYILRETPPAQEADVAALEGQASQQREKIAVGLRRIQDAKKLVQEAIPKALTIAEQRNLESWLRVYTDKEKEFNTAISALANNRPLPDVPSLPQIVNLDTAKKGLPAGVAPTIAPVGGAAPKEGVPYGGMPTGATGATPVVPEPSTPAGAELTGGLVPVVIPDTTSTPSSDIPERLTPGGMSDLLRDLPPLETTPPDTTPDVVSDTTPEVVSDTAPIATPTGPSYTDPATNVTYQPGETIGGEDRSLPNGGAVVEGVYIPPGIDYTWLGQQVPSDWEQAAQELYGGYYEMLKQVPELGRLLKEAFQKGWEPGSTSFQYALEQTDWWKTTNASARAWQEKLIRDPATATTELNTRVALLRGVAQDMGITLSPESLEQLATDSIILNFQLTSQYEDVIGSEARKSFGGVSQLRYGYVGNSIRESARKYGISLSDVTFNEWVDKIAVGAESQQTFESYAQQIARNLYPALNNGFDRGLSFAQMTDPYAQVASRILEIPGAQVDFTDPKWAAAFTMKDTKGEQMQMSFGEWADYLRTDPSFGWEYTDDAKNRAYTVVNRLGELFGAA